MTQALCGGALAPSCGGHARPSPRCALAAAGAALPACGSAAPRRRAGSSAVIRSRFGAAQRASRSPCRAGARTTSTVATSAAECTELDWGNSADCSWKGRFRCGCRTPRARLLPRDSPSDSRVPNPVLRRRSALSMSACADTSVLCFVQQTAVAPHGLSGCRTCTLRCCSWASAHAAWAAGDTAADVASVEAFFTTALQVRHAPAHAASHQKCRVMFAPSRSEGIGADAASLRLPAPAPARAVQRGAAGGVRRVPVGCVRRVRVCGGAVRSCGAPRAAEPGRAREPRVLCHDAAHLMRAGRGRRRLSERRGSSPTCRHDTIF